MIAYSAQEQVMGRALFLRVSQHWEGGVVIIISTLRALERDQVRVLTSPYISSAKIIVLLGRTSLEQRHQRHHDQ